MYTIEQYTTFLSLYNLRSIALDVFSLLDFRVFPTKKVLKDILIAKKENKEFNDYLKTYIEDAKTYQVLEELPF